MNRQQEDGPANLATLGRQHLSEETRARLQAQEDVRAAEDLIPHGVPLRFRIVKPD
jgi:hypothetical protein